MRYGGWRRKCIEALGGYFPLVVYVSEILNLEGRIDLDGGGGGA